MAGGGKAGVQISEDPMAAAAALAKIVPLSDFEKALYVRVLSWFGKYV